MDDPGMAWPAWKFGMKRDALFTTLHKQYNTTQSTIQDPDAFHHDVYEIANAASTAAEFHRLLAGRRDQRLRELNESLESASFEIIANPALVGSTQWEHALQLFRTRSLDSLVRYFASYLPSSHPWHDLPACPAEQSAPPAAPPAPFCDGALCDEPMPMSAAHSLAHASRHHDLPPSPRSLTTCSNNADDVDGLYCLNTLTPARTLSFSDSDVGGCPHELEHRDGSGDESPSQSDDDSSQSSGPDTPASMSDAEPDVAEEEHNPAVAAAYAAAALPELADATPKTLTPSTAAAAANNNNAAADNDATVNDATATATSFSPRSTRPSPVRRPLQPGFAVDVTRAPSPLPVSVRVRHRSVSPSRPWPVAHAETGRRHPAAPSGAIATYGLGRAGDRHPRHGRHHRLETIASATVTRSVSANGSARRRPGPGVEKTVLPRPMRTRLRERREAAASAAADEQQRQ